MAKGVENSPDGVRQAMNKMGIPMDFVERMLPIITPIANGLGFDKGTIDGYVSQLKGANGNNPQMTSSNAGNIGKTNNVNGFNKGKYKKV